MLSLRVQAFKNQVWIVIAIENDTHQDQSTYDNLFQPFRIRRTWSGEPITKELVCLLNVSTCRCLAIDNCNEGCAISTRLGGVSGWQELVEILSILVLVRQKQVVNLGTESFAIGEMFRAAVRACHGEPGVGDRFRAFDTICSATQDRQDAVVAMLATERLDAMVVIGGYNSSNTCNLARICAAAVPTYHIADPSGLLSRDEIRHRDVTSKREVVSTAWLPAGPLVIGLTSGASTPDNLVEAVVLTLTGFTANA